MTYPVSMNKDLCLVCGIPATQYFGANANLPLCGNLACETKLVDESTSNLMKLHKMRLSTKENE